MPLKGTPSSSAFHATGLGQNLHLERGHVQFNAGQSLNGYPALAMDRAAAALHCAVSTGAGKGIDLRFD